ncbi:MAG: hypothetical protein ACE5E4_13260 [Candidatus Binatia bacterium]
MAHTSNPEFRPEVFKPDEVKGVVAQNSVRPDRYFYLLFDSPSGEVVWEADGYFIQEPGKQPEWVINFVCPRCENSLTIKTEKKPLMVSARGLETGEPFMCTWFQKGKGPKGGMQSNLICGWKAEFALPRGDQTVEVKEHRTGKTIKVKIDAIVRRVK